MNRNIPQKEAKTVRNQLPHLVNVLHNIDLEDSKNGIKLFSVSIFDHWLTQEESILRIEVDDNLNEVKSRRQKFKSFFRELYQQTSFYTWKYKKGYRIHILKPETEKDLLRKCDLDNLWSLNGNRYSFLLPDISTIISEEWDWTISIWFLDDQKIAPIQEAASKAGLFMLK